MIAGTGKPGDVAAMTTDRAWEWTDLTTMHKNTPLVDGPELSIPPSRHVDQLEQDQIEHLIAAYQAGATAYPCAVWD